MKAQWLTVDSIQNATRLIEDQDGEVVEVDGLGVHEEIDDAARGGHDRLGARAHGSLLLSQTQTAHHESAANVCGDTGARGGVGWRKALVACKAQLRTPAHSVSQDAHGAWRRSKGPRL